MSNTPTGNVDNVSIGNAVVFIGDEATTPATDVGYLSEDGVTVSYETETVDVSAGFPRTSIRQFITGVTASLSFTTVEWNLELFEKALVGVFSTTATLETLNVGVDACPTENTGRVRFCMPCTGDTIFIEVWRMQSNGQFEIQFNGDAAHQFAFEYRMLLATQKWDGSALTADQGLFEIRRELAP